MTNCTFNKICRIFVSAGILVFTGLITYGQLTIFSDVNQAGLPGTCLQNPIYSGTSIPQNLDNLVSSIELQQGFMATLAENENGTGSAYTFVAATSTVTVNLNSNLNDKVSFIRVLPLRNTLKKGVGNTNNAWIDPLDVSWFYDWGPLDVGLPAREYALMAWGRNAANNNTSINNYIAKADITHLLSFNEPDNIDQANIPFGEAVVLHKNLAATGYRLGSPAPTEGQATVWLTNFMDSAARANVKVDFMAVHWYDWGSYSSTLNASPDPNGVFTRFKTYINNIYAIYNKPIWITEFNANRNTTSATHEAFITLALPWLEAQNFVERYAYFFPPALPPVDAGGNLTPIGNAYKNQVSTQLALGRNWDNTENISAVNSSVFEAENATLIGSSITNCANASNGKMAAAVTGSNKIIFHNVTVKDAGSYQLNIDYYAKTGRNITIQLNGNPTQVIALASSGPWCFEAGTPGTYTTTVTLNAGMNRIQFTESPILDKINVALISVVPVNFLDFYPIVKDRGIELHWTTAQEINNKYFELFRSTDGVSFESIASVPGRGNSTTAQAYDFLDVVPAVGINYYRLNQVDVDGSSKAYKIIFARYGSQLDDMRLIASNSQNLLVGINTTEAKAGTIYLAGADGKILFQKSVMLRSGFNQVFVPLALVGGGVGFLSLNTATGIYTIKVLL